jgi:hypothetical protein
MIPEIPSGLVLIRNSQHYIESGILDLDQQSSFMITSKYHGLAGGSCGFVP